MVGPVPAGHDPDAYDRLRRRILWAMPSGLYVVGSSAGEGARRRRNLMTANWCQQVAVEPKTVMVSVDVHAVTCALVAEAGAFSVSLIERQDRSLVRRFVKPVTEVDLDEAGRATVMGGQEVFEAPSGAPVLVRALAWLDCRVIESVTLGSHRVYFGEVADAAWRPDAPADPEVLRMEDTKMSYGG